MRLAATCILVSLGTAIAAHGATVLAAPRILMAQAMQRVSRDGALTNRWIHNGRPDEAARRVVRPSPDMTYSACVYDLSKGPVRVTAGAWPGYLSVSVFQANSDNVFVVNGRAAPQGIAFLLARKGQVPTGAAERVVISPSTRGIILQRRIAPTPEAFAAARRARAADVCAPVGPAAG